MTVNQQRKHHQTDYSRYVAQHLRRHFHRQLTVWQLESLVGYCRQSAVFYRWYFLYENKNNDDCVSVPGSYLQKEKRIWNRNYIYGISFTRCHHQSRHRIAAYYSFIDLKRMKGWVWPCWLTCSRWFTHVTGHSSDAGRCRTRKVTTEIVFRTDISLYISFNVVLVALAIHIHASARSFETQWSIIKCERYKKRTETNIKMKINNTLDNHVRCNKENCSAVWLSHTEHLFPKYGMTFVKQRLQTWQN